MLAQLLVEERQSKMTHYWYRQTLLPTMNFSDGLKKILQNIWSILVRPPHILSSYKHTKVTENFV